MSEFENLIINGDTCKRQVTACYLVGLRFDIGRVIFMQPYNTLHDVIKLALKVEALNKHGSSITTKSVTKERFAKGSTSWNPNGGKPTPTPQVKSKVHKPQQELTLISKTCFKCQGLGHIDFECPNQKFIALIEEDEGKKEDVEVIESNHVQKDEAKSSLSSKFESEKEIKVGSDVINLVIQDIKREGNQIRSETDSRGMC